MGWMVPFAVWASDQSLRGSGNQAGSVPCGVQDSPYVDVRFAFDVEDQVGKALHAARAQAGKTQFVGVTGRTAGGVLGHLAEGRFQRIDEGQHDIRWRNGRKVIDGLVDIVPRPPAKNDWFWGHRLPDSRTLSRSWSK